MRALLTEQTCKELHSVIKIQRQYFHLKYENCFKQYGKDQSSKVKFYRHVFDTYCKISEVLDHLYKYKTLISLEHCTSCRFDVLHRKNLEHSYKIFLPLISKLKDSPFKLNK